ncbi:MULTISPECIES: phosphatidate cytidylyltransferase [unclassified Pantoea]|uniref:phosphatidate cytidylyltransferase n=1 Tax=unclassified Pantoea TaxID=2630326 RepID=UPI0010C98474|nr:MULTISPECIES: phosphatidate cytidylyltransferase [unclassified Pantoea]MBY4837923.1 phosphatidate cytidylyltransferase [Pantoea sp. DY-5]QCP58828.1 phosphatidate cytidylyltransferase [Pantoea sp. SO10]WGK58228.1 phosphatidate cytidylyltransferase [Pantoea sp. SS70]
MADSRHLLYYCLGGIFGVLMLATLIIFVLRKCRPQRNWLELQQRVNSWWVIICLFSLAMLSPKWLALTFFGFISFLSLKEYLTLAPTRRSDSMPLLWMYAAIPVQYLWTGMAWYGMFIIFIPVYVFLFLPARMVIAGDTKGFLHSASVMHWGMMTTVFALSHVAYLMTLPGADASAGALLVFFLVALTELNDIAQYLWGKSLGRIRVTPNVSPNKTLAGLLGGIFTTMLLAVILGPLLTPMSFLHSLGAGLIIGASGFCGDVVMSAIKRDFGVKDSGKLLPGHGGILDRLDSLIYTAPLFFHFYYYFYV